MSEDSKKPPLGPTAKAETANRGTDASSPPQDFDKKNTQSEGSDFPLEASSEAHPSQQESAQTRNVSAAKNKDMVFVHSRTDDGEGYRVIRFRQQQLEVAELRTPQDGQPLHGELVSLKPREENAQLFDVEILVDRKERASGRGRPAKVTSNRYRRHWDQVFGSSDHSDPAGKPN